MAVGGLLSIQENCLWQKGGHHNFIWDEEKLRSVEANRAYKAKVIQKPILYIMQT